MQYSQLTVGPRLTQSQATLFSAKSTVFSRTCIWEQKKGLCTVRGASMDYLLKRILENWGLSGDLRN